MAQFEVIRFAIELEIHRINDPCAGSPRDCFLSLYFADLEIVIEKSSGLEEMLFPRSPTYSTVKSGNSIFSPVRYFTRVPYDAFCSDAACPQLTGPAKANKPPTKKIRVKLFFTCRKFSESFGTLEATHRA